MNRDELMALSDLQVKEVETGGRVFHVRSISALELVSLEADMKKSGDDVSQLLAVQLSCFLSSEAGERLLSAEDAAVTLKKWSAKTVKAIVSAGSELNGLGKQEELQGN